MYGWNYDISGHKKSCSGGQLSKSFFGSGGKNFSMGA
jgi:hypothetical protein